MTINCKLLLPSLAFQTFTDCWPYPSSFPDNKEPQFFSSIIMFYLQFLLHPFLLGPSSAWSTLSVHYVLFPSWCPVTSQISSEVTQLSSTAAAAKLLSISLNQPEAPWVFRLSHVPLCRFWNYSLGGQWRSTPVSPWATVWTGPALCSGWCGCCPGLQNEMVSLCHSER